MQHLRLLARKNLDPGAAADTVVDAVGQQQRVHELQYVRLLNERGSLHGVSQHARQPARDIAVEIILKLSTNRVKMRLQLAEDRFNRGLADQVLNHDGPVPLQRADLIPEWIGCAEVGDCWSVNPLSVCRWEIRIHRKSARRVKMLLQVAIPVDSQRTLLLPCH